MLEFKGSIKVINGWNIIQIPSSISLEFPSRGMVMASGFINKQAIVVPLEPDGIGSHWFMINDTYMKSLDLSPGDQVELSLESMDVWEGPDLPFDLVESLKRSDLLKKWSTLTIKSRWDWIRWIRSTKSPVTRAKRINVMCSKLSSGDRRPCCFNRNTCTITDVSKSGILIET